MTCDWRIPKDFSKKKRQCAVDVLDDVRQKASGLRSRLDRIVKETEKQISNHQRGKAWVSGDVIKLAETFVEYAKNLEVATKKLKVSE